MLDARAAAEAAAAAALEGLGVFSERRPEHLGPEQAELRRGLRAKWRQLDRRDELLVSECAYEQWHRLLFARFLAENGLLLHPRYRARLTIADCEDLAGDLDEPDGWSVAARFAAEILPGIFRLEDPCVRLRLAPEGRQELEAALDRIPAEAFSARDALGWVYQFWQREKKDEVNASERKIGGADVGPVTQLFTESYMVRFLLENTLGAWWASRHPDSPLLGELSYLRRDEDGCPAAGGFEGWPDRVAEVTAMDPCCGSGHFLVEAFSLLWRMRAEEEGLAAAEAQDAVLRDNLFGLELDPRCVQIAMFALALEAWRSGGGWRQLPVPNVACSGIPVRAPAEEWTALAKGDERLAEALGRLHVLFRDADTLASLIDPRESAEGLAAQRSLESVDWAEVEPLVDRAAAAEAGDPAGAVLGADAVSLVRAVRYLTRSFTLTATNVPYLGRGRQAEVLRDHLERHYAQGVGDLAAACALRCLRFAAPGGTVALVLPETLFFLKTYEAFRDLALGSWNWLGYAPLGPGAFETIGGEVVQPVLWTASAQPPEDGFVALDCREARGLEAKAELLASAPLARERQEAIRRRPGMKVALGLGDAEANLAEYARGVEGLSTGDNPRYRRFFWELPEIGADWERFQTAPSAPGAADGLSDVIHWQGGKGPLASDPGARVQGLECWGRPGVLVGRMGAVVATAYRGTAYDKSCVVLLPHAARDLPAIARFAEDPSYERTLRSFDKKIGVATGSTVEVPFDLEHWRQVAREAGPAPKPRVADPTQWPFEGLPEDSAAPLQVAVARLLGYRWPGQARSDHLDGFADADGIVCLPSVAGEAPAADRLQALLSTALRQTWTPAKTRELLEEAGSAKASLADWLRDEFFKQHCALFGSRPFVWHVWDGRRDGFSALLNYHRLDRRALEKLTYTYLGQDWVERQRAGIQDEAPGAEARLAAALELQSKLTLILEGEQPYDVYVRWKGTDEQPVGWEPDLDDGVRLNVRPFVEAGILRCRFNVSWRKDRGRNEDGSERLNDRHLTLAEKRGQPVGERR